MKTSKECLLYGKGGEEMRATPKMIKNKTYGRAICNQKHCSGTAKGSDTESFLNKYNSISATTSSQESSPQRFMELADKYEIWTIEREDIGCEFEKDLLKIREQAREEMANKINEFIEKRKVSESPTWLTLKIDIATFVNKQLGEEEKK